MISLRGLVLAAALGACVLQAGAQEPGGPPPGDQGPPAHEHRYGRGPDAGGGGNMHGGMQLGPPGRWWDDPALASDLHLKADQQTRMDAIFAQNKSTLMARFDNLRQEERQLGTMSRGVNIDEHALFAQIDRVSQARAELEKANAHMLLLLRHELIADQVSALDDLRPPPPR